MNNNWHRALDAQIDSNKYYLTHEGIARACSFFQRALHLAPDQEFYRMPELIEIPIDIYRNFVSGLARGDTMFVTSDMLRVLLQASHDLPDEAEFDQRTLLSNHGFLLLEEPIIGEDTHGYTVHVHAIVWMVERSPLKFKHLVENADDPIVLLYFLTDSLDKDDQLNQLDYILHAEQGTPLPPFFLTHFFPISNGVSPRSCTTNEPGNALVVAMVKFFMAMNLVAQQSIGEPQRLVPPRHVRKRAIKWDMHNQRYITLITLRRKSVKKDDHEPEKIERTHRWIVRGHWRKQWYPSMKAHQWKYIYEHIKGPEDKPLIISERRVFNFRR